MTEEQHLEELGTQARKATAAFGAFVLSIVALVAVIVVFVLNADDASTETVRSFADPCVQAPRGEDCRQSIIERATAIEPQVACIIVSKGRMYAGLEDLDCNLETLLTPRQERTSDRPTPPASPGDPRTATSPPHSQPTPDDQPESDAGSAAGSDSVGTPSPTAPDAADPTPEPSTPGTGPSAPGPRGPQGEPGEDGQAAPSLLPQVPCVQTPVASVAC